ncbi:hypothetical protein A2617_04800 [Candidatus Daviesbacteria bacterium RIFOXYD1_FULL_41_10]|uniref:Uncharacterized protein n=2 Tax=Candidatus Daviesiibacteriota TaxID=1752718 RepID=A0A1F5N2U0_9BACT|nr:MAG: hypothetical protein UU67_C0045G0005 [Candidatus Daviesbacteria bacterium GW2011_GWB1_41_5]OGE71966.1 MAG: hypothetical protein A2617_04800 [Candidatus Daviesbacteria bacterium RIFOXYD1_FULL_41_10]
MAKSDDLTQIKELLEVVKHKVERQEIFLDATAANVRFIKDQQSVMNKKMDGMKQTLDAHDLKVPHFAE